MRIVKVATGPGERKGPRKTKHRFCSVATAQMRTCYGSHNKYALKKASYRPETIQRGLFTSFTDIAKPSMMSHQVWLLPEVVLDTAPRLLVASQA